MAKRVTYEEAYQNGYDDYNQTGTYNAGSYAWDQDCEARVGYVLGWKVAEDEAHLNQLQKIKALTGLGNVPW